MDAVYEHPLKTQTEPGKPIIIKTTLLLVSSLSVMAGAIIAAGLPQLAMTFSNWPHSEMMAKLMLTFPALFVALFGPWAGSLSDRIGRRKVLTFSLLLYAVAGSSGLYFSHPYLLLLGRAGLGISVAAVMTVSVALAGDLFKGYERQAFMGQQAAFMALGGLVFITFGGWLADLHWRLPFAVYGVGILLAWPVWKVFKVADASAPVQKASIKIPVQYDRQLLTTLYILAFLGMLVFYLVPVQLPFFLKQRIQADGIQIGMVIGTSTLFGAISSFAFNRLIKKLDFFLITVLSFLSMAFAFQLFLRIETIFSALVAAMPAGLGFGLLMPNFSFKLITIAPELVRGKIMGGLTFSFFMGQFVSPLMTGILPAGLEVFFVASIGLIVLAGIVLVLRKLIP